MLTPRDIILTSMPLAVPAGVAIFMYAPIMGTAVLGFVFFLMATLKPEWSVLGITGVIAFDVYLGGMFLSQVLVVATFAGTLINLSWTNRTLKWDWFYLFPLSLLLSCIIPIAFATARWPAGKYAIKFSGLVMLMVLTRTLGSSMVFLRRFLITLAISASLAALYGVSQTIAGHPVRWIDATLHLVPITSYVGQGGQVFRAYSSFRYALEFGLYLHLVLSILLVSFLLRSSIINRWWTGLGCIAVMMGFISSFARSAWAGSLLSGILILIWAMRKRRGIVIGLTAAIGILVLGLSTFDFSRLSGSVVDVSSDLARLELWQLGLQIVRAHPLIGIGQANIPYHLPPMLMGGESYQLPNLENLYLNWAAEAGIPSMIVLVTFFGWIIVIGLKALDGPAPRPIAAIQLGIALAVLGTLINGLSDPIMGSTQTGALLFMMAGIQRATQMRYRPVSDQAWSGSYGGGAGMNFENLYGAAGAGEY